MPFATEIRSQIKNDEIILIQNGKNNSLISYTEFGKVIIVVNNPSITCGYARVDKVVKEADKYILVEAENIIHDYYDTISYNELKNVLKLHGYKIGFDRPFETGYKFDYQLLAYNPSNGVVIVAETYYGGKSFNSIKVYCPNVCVSTRPPCFSMGDSSMCVLDLCYGRNMKNMLFRINNMISNPIWPSSEYISLSTYKDSESIKTGVNDKWGFISSNLWASTIDRILLADKGIEKILGRCDKLKPVFESRIKTG